MRKRDKEKVIKTGLQLFSTQGYHRTGTEEILQKSDYPRSSFYYHFKNKEGFATRVLGLYGDNTQQFYAAILTDKKLGNPLERLRHFTQLMVGFIKKDKFMNECLIQKFSVECAANNDVLCESANQELDKILNVI